MGRSTINSTINGKAYEYACVLALQKTVSPIRPIRIEQNESLNIAQSRYENEISTDEQNKMLLSASVGINTIIEMEPRITEDGKDELTISLQPDNIAIEIGDIRDVLIIRRSIEWEIGISVKHNHAALKHSRLSTHLDFGNVWFGVPCSINYFDEIKPIFDRLKTLKDDGITWNTLSDKDDAIYLPLLDAFTTELKRIYYQHNEIMPHLIEYLLGSNGKDYYKLIHNNNHTTTVMPFNIYGTLNKPTKTTVPQISVPRVELPTRIIEIALKNGSKTTTILTMDNGWSISFRIHNASSIVEPSLKFDIQLQSKPEDIFYLDKEW